MAPEILNRLEIDELREKAQQVKDWQLTRKLSESQLIKKFPHLGSDRTFNRILKGDIGEMDVESQLQNYRAVVALIEAIGSDEETPEEDLLDNLSGVAALRRAFTAVSREKGNARFVIMLGENGTGKTSARRVLAQRFGTRLLCIEADDTWNDKPNSLSGSILAALGVKFSPPGQSDRFALAIEKLNETRRALFVDEGHHLGPKLLNLLKTIINKTPTEVFVMAIPTLWRKLEGAAWEEARQLTGNRLAEKIVLSVTEGDVEKIIRHRLPNLAPEALKPAVASIKLRCTNPKSGNLAVLREVINRLRVNHKDADSVSLEQWGASVAAEDTKRAGGNGK